MRGRPPSTYRAGVRPRWRSPGALTRAPTPWYNCHVHACVSDACVLHDRMSARKWQPALATGFSTSLCASP